MLDHTRIALDLPTHVVKALHKRAKGMGTSLSCEAYQMLVLGLHFTGTPARTPVRAEERGDLLAEDLAYAKGWTDLQNRLALHGYEFRERGGGLAL